MPVSRCGTHCRSISMPGAAAAAHLAGGAGEPGRAHVLNADDGARLHRFQAGFQQQLFHERIAHLHVGPLLLGLLGELGRRHGRAVDAVAPGLRADVDHGIADARRLARRRSRPSGRRPGRTRSPADCRRSTARRRSRRPPWARRSSCRSARCRRPRLPRMRRLRAPFSGSSSGPKRSASITAMGRAPMVKMSRRMPPTPVAAPWNGSMKLG